MGLTYTIKNQEGQYFITCTVNQWINIFTRDLKKFTATKIVEAISNNTHESRKRWLLSITIDNENLYKCLIILYKLLQLV